MSEQEPRKRAFLFGSAGMAASGMVPKTSSKEPTVESYGILRKSVDPNPEEESEQEADVESDVTTEEEIESKVGNEESPSTGEESVSDEKSDDEFDVRESEVTPAAEIHYLTWSGESADEPGTEAKPEEDETEAEPKKVPPRRSNTRLKAALLCQSGSDADADSDPLMSVFAKLKGFETVALSDSDPERRQQTQVTTSAPNAYEDFQKLLEKENLDAVAVSATDSAIRFEMIKAALEKGAHVICGSRFVNTLKEAHELSTLAEEKGLQLAVLNTIACDVHINDLAARASEVIGELLEIRAYGKMGAVAGGEDLLRHAPPLFDLIRLFAGDVTWCSAHVTQDGEWAMRDNIYEKEGTDLGPLLGDKIQAQFETTSGVHASYVSSRNWRSTAGQYGLELIGSETTVRIQASTPPVLSHWDLPNPELPTRADFWSVWPSSLAHDTLDPANHSDDEAGVRRVAREWLRAINKGAELHCSAERATKALEMVHGVWQAGISGKRAYFPLVNRLHPLSAESL